MTNQIKSKEQLIAFIKNKTRPTVVGSSTSDNAIYQEIPFSGYEEFFIHRKNSHLRIESIVKHIDIANKKILDIGCNNGYFSFELVRMGAKQCIGVDYDHHAITIAKALKHIHRVEAVEFIHGKFTDQLLGQLIEKYGHFDLILLNSVIHWLVFDYGSIRKVISLLNRLQQAPEQFIIYEPSSSVTAYYPELLEKKNIISFFTGLGVTEYKPIGEHYVSNIKSNRQLWLGKRDLFQVARTIDEFLADGQQVAEGDICGDFTVNQVCRGKICLRGKNYFIKTTQHHPSSSRIFLEHEYKMATILSQYPRYTPILIGRLETSRRLFLFYETISGTGLQESYIRKKHVSWIDKELHGFLDILKLLGLTHNDMKPQNIFINKSVREIRIIDYEFCGSGTSVNQQREKPWFPFEPSTKEEKELLDFQIGWVGGEYRSPFGVGFFENDLFAVNKIVYMLKNRKLYRKYKSYPYKKYIYDRIKLILVKLFGKKWLERYKNNKKTRKTGS